MNDRREDPNVDGAYVPTKSFFIPPWRSNAMSSIESAPASIPATNAVTFNPEFAPKYPGNVSQASARSLRPDFTANAIAGTSPAADTRFVSSKVADKRLELWKSCIYEMPLGSVEMNPNKVLFFLIRVAFSV